MADRCVGCGEPCDPENEGIRCQGCDRLFCEACAAEKWECIGEESGCAECVRLSLEQFAASDRAEAEFIERVSTLAIKTAGGAE